MDYSRPSFRLPEILVLIVVIGILVGMLLPGVQTVRVNRGRSESSNNLRHLGIASHNAHDANGSLPPLFDYYPADADAIRKGKLGGLGPVLFHLLPFLEQDPLYKATRTPMGAGWCYQFDQAGASSQPIKTFINPGDPSAPRNGVSVGNGQAVCSYGANALVFGKVDADGNLVMTLLWSEVFTSDGKARIPGTFRDGTSFTILFAEKYAECNSAAHPDHGSLWDYPLGRVAGMASFGNTYDGAYPSAVVRPGEVGPTYGANKFQERLAKCRTGDCDPARAQAMHRSGILVCLGDASVRLVDNRISLKTWMAASTPSQDDGVGSDW